LFEAGIGHGLIHEVICVSQLHFWLKLTAHAGPDAWVLSSLSDRLGGALKLRATMPSRPPISSYRFPRLIAWLCALLAWVATGALHRNRATPALAKLRKMVWCTIVIIAADYVRLEKRPIPRRYGKPPCKRVPLRAIGGAWLRRRVRARGSLMAQAVHLIGVLAIRHALARQLAHRRRKAFTRRAPILAVAGAPEPLCAIAPMRAFANSS
jgi:hypothetical protein